MNKPVLTPSTDPQDVLLELLLARDERGMQRLFQNYGAALYRIITTVIEDEEEARDVMQDTLLRIWTSIDQYSPRRSRLFTWMARIARNAAIDRVRSKAFRNRRKTDTLTPTVFSDGGPSVSTPVEHIGIGKLLRHLDDNHRAVIEHLFFHDLTQAETAKALDLPIGTVKTRSRRALRKLRKVAEFEA